jgi:hypothetical protein
MRASQKIAALVGLTTLVLAALTPVARGQQTSSAISITSPVDGSIVAVGQNLPITVTVSAGTSVIAVQVIGENIGITPPVSSPPYTFSLVVPSTTIGRQRLTALGVVSPGDTVFSQSIVVDCEPTTALTALSANLSQISFQYPGQQIPLRAIGTLSGGSSLDVTESSLTSYSSSNKAVATVDSTGLTTAVGAGTTTILINNGNRSASVNISVPAAIRGDLNADGKVDQDDVNVLLVALNTKATGSFDARDLNGDGVIDSSDLQLLAALCSLSGCVTNANAVSAPVAVLVPYSLSFPGQVVGSPSAPQSVTLVNTGSSPLNITNISTNGDFVQTSTCGPSLPAMASCVVNVVFVPSTTGLMAGAVTFTDNASGAPHTATLGGIGTAPALSVPSGTTSFSGQLVGTTSTVQNITVTNSGTATLTVNSLTITGVNSDDFKKGTDTCSTSVMAGANCAIPISFAPTGTGTRNAALTITDNAPGSPHVFTLSGAGTDFSLSVQAGSLPAATVTAGQTATYNLQLTPTGFSGTVSLGCTGAPTLASCSISPSSTTFNGASTATATVSITTTTRALLLPTLRFRLPWLFSSPEWIVWVLLLCALFAFTLRWHPAPRRAWFPFAALFALFVLGCAGGGSGGGSPTPPPQQGTPAGTYTLQVNATSGGTTRTVSLTLVVN